MREVNLRAVDLNLLVVLKALLDEQHISKAALHLNMSQPAVSRALQRLRLTLDDPLLVRTGSGYDLSARAEQLKHQLDRILYDVEQVMQPALFKPESAEELLKISGLDLEVALYMPKLVSALRSQAPGLRIEFVPQSSDLFYLLEQGKVHFSISGFQPETAQDQYRRLEIARTQNICLMSESNSLAQGQMSLDQYVKAQHGLVSITGYGPGKMDKVLADMGLQRNVLLRLSSFMSVAEFCRNSELIFTLPKHLALHLAQQDGLVTRPLPTEFELPDIVFYLYWHARFHDDPMCCWVREQFTQLFPV